MDRTIRPGLQADGGDLEILEFKDNEIKILYMGACGDCPSAMMGTLDAIQNILRHELGNDELRVRPV
ncbi:MAG: NifU family protein [Bdellovibrionales bacterium]